MTGFVAILARDLRLALRHGADTMGALLFFFVAGTLFPLAIGPSPAVLARLAPGIVWVCALLAALLPLDRVFAGDFEDGSLDQMLVAGVPPIVVALGKAVAHWLESTAVPARRSCWGPDAAACCCPFWCCRWSCRC
jgi:heme exporter protein B